MLKYGACDITIGVINGQIQPTIQRSTVNGQRPTANGRKLRVVRCGVVCGGGVVGWCVAVVVFLVEVRCL